MANYPIFYPQDAEGLALSVFYQRVLDARLEVLKTIRDDSDYATRAIDALILAHIEEAVSKLSLHHHAT